MSRRTELDLAAEAARAAGARLRELFEGEKDILSEAGRDIKLQADRDSEQIIVERLQRDGRHPILAEEGGAYGAAEGAFWVIDPLDGTLNFSRGFPLCCVSIGLVEGERPVLGVIYDFTRDELFAGAAGEGAWLNGRAIRASERTDRAQAVLATGLPTFTDFSDAALLDFVRLMGSFKKPRCIGSAALSLAGVASGRFDAYAEDHIMLWDVAAGAALVEAAGGYVSLEPSGRRDWARIVRVAGRAEIWAEREGRS